MTAITTVTIPPKTAPASPPGDPLHVLQCYLSSLPPFNSKDSSQVQQERTDQVLRVADFLFNNSLEGALVILENASNSITKVVAASSRSVYLVRGSSTRAKSGETYLCYISKDNSQPLSMHHCSCRSFWERCKSSGASTLCKHLLALHLMPALGIQCHVVDSVTDDEFANTVLSRLTVE
jgi:predicted nucleic acid-binding Zn finger protein